MNEQNKSPQYWHGDFDAETKSVSNETISIATRVNIKIFDNYYPYSIKEISANGNLSNWAYEFLKSCQWNNFCKMPYKNFAGDKGFFNINKVFLTDSNLPSYTGLDYLHIHPWQDQFGNMISYIDLNNFDVNDPTHESNANDNIATYKIEIPADSCNGTFQTIMLGDRKNIYGVPEPGWWDFLWQDFRYSYTYGYEFASDGNYIFCIYGIDNQTADFGVADLNGNPIFSKKINIPRQPPPPTGRYIASDDNILYIINNLAQLYVVSKSGDIISGPFNLPSEAQFCSGIGCDDRFLYIINKFGDLLKIEKNDFSSVKKIKVNLEEEPFGPPNLECDKNFLYMVSGANGLYKLTKNGEIIGKASLAMLWDINQHAPPLMRVGDQVWGFFARIYSPPNEFRYMLYKNLDILPAISARYLLPEPITKTSSQSMTIEISFLRQ